MSTAAEKAAVRKYQKSRDNIMIRPDKETGAQIRQAAADAGQSVQQYILRLLLTSPLMPYYITSMIIYHTCLHVSM